MVRSDRRGLILTKIRQANGLREIPLCALALEINSIVCNGAREETSFRTAFFYFQISIFESENKMVSNFNDK